jgi:integrase
VDTMAPMRLTDNAVKRLPPPASGNKITYDDLVMGFGCRVTARGHKSFVLTYRRRADRRQRRYTIGPCSYWSTATAREEARRLKRKIDSGGDPVGELEATRAAATTVADLAARFTDEVLPRNRASTRRDYRQQIATDILPVLGDMKVSAVTHSDVDKLHHKISARAPIHANRVVALLSRLFSLAVRWGLRADNPCKGIERNAEEKRQRYLSAAELARLSTALANLRDQSAANAVRLLLLTGARRGELLAARWVDFDLETGVWTKPGSTTKQKTLHRVPLSESACRLLTEMRAGARASPWLFPARLKVGHRTDIEDAWNALRKAAKIPDVRLHDLRHSYASVLASAGLSLPVIGALLGHATPTTTHRYAHLFDDPLRAATERASEIIAGKRP